MSTHFVKLKKGQCK